MTESPANADNAALLRSLDRERRARKEAEQRLEEKSRELYDLNKNLAASVKAAQAKVDHTRSVLEHMPNAVLVTSSEGEVQDINSYGRQRFNISVDDAKGQPLSTFLPAFEDLASDIALNSFNATVPVITTARDTLQREFPCEVVATMTGMDNLIWMIRDITTRVESERKREQLEAQLQQAQKLESLGTMAGGIAHELNTPIQFIRDNMNFLADSFEMLAQTVKLYATHVPPDIVAQAEEKFDLKYISDEVPQAITQSIEGLGRVAEIVLAIKRFSHPTSNKKEAVDINQVISTTTTVSKNNWKYLANLELDLAPGLPPIQGNAGELNQVFLNLVVNAAQAIEEKGIKDSLGTLKISTSAIPGGIECRVSDSGAGIKPENLQRIFDLFFTTKAPGKGTGQGLALVHTIVTTSHGGKISVESKLGEGSTFIVQLPFDGIGQSWPTDSTN